jgi:hypothetical protein
MEHINTLYAQNAEAVLLKLVVNILTNRLHRHQQP